MMPEKVHQRVRRALIIGTLLELPFACCLLLSRPGIDNVSGLTLACLIVHFPAVGFLTMMAQPFTPTPRDEIVIPQILTFITTAILLSAIVFLVMTIRGARGRSPQPK
jgi:hypothetical protein